jgi:hypothetical protein
MVESHLALDRNLEDRLEMQFPVGYRQSFEGELIVEGGVLIDGLKPHDTFSLFGAASQFILVAGILYFEEALKLLDTPRLLLHLHHVPHHHHPHPHCALLPRLQAVRSLVAHVELTGDFLHLPAVELVLVGADERNHVLLLLPVGEIGRVGENMRVGFILKIQFAEVFEPVSRRRNLRNVRHHSLQLRFRLC